MDKNFLKDINDYLIRCHIIEKNQDYITEGYIINSDDDLRDILDCQGLENVWDYPLSEEEYCKEEKIVVTKITFPDGSTRLFEELRCGSNIDDGKENNIDDEIINIDIDIEKDLIDDNDDDDDIEYSEELGGWKNNQAEVLTMIQKSIPNKLERSHVLSACEHYFKRSNLLDDLKNISEYGAYLKLNDGSILHSAYLNLDFLSGSPRLIPNESNLLPQIREKLKGMTYDYVVDENRTWFRTDPRKENK